MKGKLKFFLVLILLNGSGNSATHEWTLAGFRDSNPIESVQNPEPVLGLKLQDRIRFDHQIGAWQLDGVAVAQGFLEPQLFLDSKLVGRAQVDLRRKLNPNWHLSMQGSSFQKLYLKAVQHSSRDRFKLKLVRTGPGGASQVLGYSVGHAQVNSGELYVYHERQSFVQMNVPVWSRHRLELDLSYGLINFDDRPVHLLGQGNDLVLGSDDQRDVYVRSSIHLQYRAGWIYGVLLSREVVNSNSILGESQTWLAKVYFSRRFGPDWFMHVVLQGMDKAYRLEEIEVSNNFRDPEELIQNQVHLQLERRLDPNRSVYLQYGFLKNETILNQWFYEKQILEVGLKIKL